MIHQEIEIMSPVGSYESLMAAIQAGARSVYFGIDQLNMRSRSSYNFSIADLEKISHICHEYRIKSYVTLNTVLYDEDIDLMKNIIDEIKENDISAVIVSDQAAINYARQKKVEIHLSTQLSISNIEALKFYSKYADVVVLARELDLQQITAIHKAIINENIIGPSGNLIRIEVFIHGALCMAISGKCFMSLHLHNTSANRGACYQVCRREFNVFDENGLELKLNNHFIMSPKDLCTVGILDRIIEAGASLLKIEGRGRSPEYVYNTTKVYKDAVDAVLTGSFNKNKINQWTTKLKTIYNRGFWEGHYLGEYSADWQTNIYGSNATTRKIYIGKGIKYFKKTKIGEFLVETGSLSLGDKILITGPTTGIFETTVTELRINNQIVNNVSKNDNFSMPIDSIIRRNDKLYLVVENSVN